MLFKSAYPLLSGVLDINEQPGDGEGLDGFCLEIDEDMETSLDLQPTTNISSNIS